MCDLAYGMNACIGSPGTVKPDHFGSKTNKRRLEVVLDPVFVGLALPSAKTTTIIRNGEPQPFKRVAGPIHGLKEGGIKIKDDYGWI